MRSANDDASLRFSAIYPEMSRAEFDRAATHISKGWTLDDIRQAEQQTVVRGERARREIAVAQMQLLILERAKEFKARKA